VPDIATLLQLIRDAKPGPDGWVTAFGFDINLYRDGRAIALAELDAARSDVPVFISDQSGHAASVNSLALEKAGLDARTPNPPGGEYVRDASGRLTGRLLGHAAMFSVYPPPTPSQESALRGALEHARAGITTSTEGGIINPAAPAVLLEA
jgi:predicted amidohydrolase YtcJ